MALLGGYLCIKRELREIPTRYRSRWQRGAVKAWDLWCSSDMELEHTSLDMHSFKRKCEKNGYRAPKNQQRKERLGRRRVKMVNYQRKALLAEEKLNFLTSSSAEKDFLDREFFLKWRPFFIPFKRKGLFIAKVLLKHKGERGLIRSHDIKSSFNGSDVMGMSYVTQVANDFSFRDVILNKRYVFNIYWDDVMIPVEDVDESFNSLIGNNVG
ncbi:hypothetical protein Gotur_033614 [Gossypium turneri]